MRASSAVLTDTSVRLWDLAFPVAQPLMERTRAAYVHLDNLIAYSKRDRDAKVDAYLACYRPDETVLLFFQRGELANAAVLAPAGRFAVALGEALHHIRAEPERAEVAFHAAPLEQLAAMYACCAQPPQDLGLDPANPDAMFKGLAQSQWSGLLELIAANRASYVKVQGGRFQSGHFADRREDEDARSAMARIFAGRPGEPKPKVSVRAVPGLDALPPQATPALIQVFRAYVWDVAELAEREMPGEGAKRAEKSRTKLSEQHEALRGVGGPRGAESADPICEPQQLSEAIAAWTRDFLGELEIMHPGIAARLVREAGREQRYALGAVGFFEKLPWRIEW
jgi:hypothetical protein